MSWCSACVTDVKWTLLLVHFSFNEHSWEADARLNVALGWTVIFYCCFLLQFLSGHLVKHRLAHFLCVCVCVCVWERSFSRQSLNLHVSAALSQRIMSSTLYVKMTRFPQTVPLFQRPTCLFVKHIYSFSYSLYCESRNNLVLHLLS